MIKTIVKENHYHDSVVLMLLTNKINNFESVNRGSIMMGTPANKGILKERGLYTEEMKSATANDLLITLDIENEDDLDLILQEIDVFLADQGNPSDEKETEAVKTWDQALRKMPDANLVLLSLPGMYAALEAEKALDYGLHVFMFSDNVPPEDEKYLKRKAHKKGLLVMGPDCGTSILGGIPLAFTNVVRAGRIGIIGASGTGIQEVSTLIHRLGCGVSNAIGTGGNDLSEEIKAITMLDGIAALNEDLQTNVIVVISKPPAKSVKEQVLSALRAVSKPVVVLFLGQKLTYHEGHIYHAYTLEETAQLAVKIERQQEVSYEPLAPKEIKAAFQPEQTAIKAYYSGGTLAYEAGMLIKDGFSMVDHDAKPSGFILNSNGHVVIDLGADEYTQGKPHPMIDPENRKVMIEEAGKDESSAIILFDIVLGYGGHENMAGSLLPAVEKAREHAENNQRTLVFIATIVGTNLDLQNYDQQKNSLEKAGIIVCEHNTQAIRTALKILGKSVSFIQKKAVSIKRPILEMFPVSSQKILQLLTEKPRVINMGLKSFAEVIKENEGDAIHFDWKPSAGGNLHLQKTLHFLAQFKGEQLKEYKTINEANKAIIEKIMASSPSLLDVVPAKSVIKELNGKVLLHAGAPILWENMTSPMQGSCIGAVLFEMWADNEEDARKLLENNEVTFIPCHHVNAVGPMSGIISSHMPVFVVENKTDNNQAYCTMNEGIGAVLRFGAYSKEVIERLRWMQETLGPVLGQALRAINGGLNLNVIIAKAIAMGDEFHQRNMAASLVFLKEVAPIISGLTIDDQRRREVITFLADTDQFFLNIMMAAAKSVMDGARTIEVGTVVTAMCRNGENFGIRISGMGDQWFTAPVNTPQGLYFTGYSSEDASPDIGDSAITETFGVGGMAMIAAPAVTRFVGTGGFYDALAISNEMLEIAIAQNPNFKVPTWNFQGICLGIDARKVVETGVTPIINTGIAHKKAGIGQIGAGTVYPPIECFEQAITAYGEKLGMNLKHN